MEQWVSDTFYSYFPSFNNENQKRQAILHEKQLENQKNYMKQMVENSSVSKNNAHRHHNKQNRESQNHMHMAARPTNRSRSFHKYTPPDKTDLEIIVTNPNYGSKSPPIRKKISTQILPDLRHSSPKKMIYDGVIQSRNHTSSQKEANRKKSYQNQLMKQIEAKRKQVEILKEKEKLEEEELTKTLEDQLKTVQLEEALERENLRIDEIRLDAEKNKIMRGNLLRKLENDRKLLPERETKSENDKDSVQVQAIDDRKIYKYFSNSAQQEYNHQRRQQFLLNNDLNLDINELDGEDVSIDSCCHSSKEVCPVCYTKLKHYQVWCLKCNHSHDESSPVNCSLSCDSCGRQYRICDSCEKRRELCKVCQKKGETNSRETRNVCINCGNDVKPAMVRSKRYPPLSNSSVHQPGSERSFQILEVNYPENEDMDVDMDNINLNNYEEKNRPPFSINTDSNCFCLPDNKFHEPKYELNILNGEVVISKLIDENKKRLNINTIKTQSTQTTPIKEVTKLKKKNTVVTEGNLYMPLLRESSNRTKNLNGQTNKQLAEKNSSKNNMKNLEGKWDIPIVQRHTITTSSPKVITQLGAIRKQLQTNAVERQNL